MLLNANADVNIADANGKTPLYIASKEGHSTIVEMLLNANADVNTVTDVDFGIGYSKTPLYIASKGGHSTIVEMLLNANADVNTVTDGLQKIYLTFSGPLGHLGESGESPLNMASYRGHSTIVEMLLNANADVN
ncbi:unnamed protein product, partial [Meganyctiphanes norvegica]